MVVTRVLVVVVVEEGVVVVVVDVDVDNWVAERSSMYDSFSDSESYAACHAASQENWCSLEQLVS